MKKTTCCFIFAAFIYSASLLATPLSLQTVLNSTNKHFPAIIAEKEKLQSAEYNLVSAKGSFDPNIKLSVVNSPNGYYQNTYANSEISARLPDSAERVFAGYRIGLGKFPVYDQKNWTYDYGETRAGVSIPLSRNQKTDPDRAKINERQFAITLQQDRLSFEKLSLMREASIAYWAWIAEGEKLSVQKKLLIIAEKRQILINKRVEKGDLAKIDSVDNERIVIQRKSRVAEQALLFQNAGLALSLYVRDKNGKIIDPSQFTLPDSFPSPILLNRVFSHQVSSTTSIPDMSKILNANPALHQIRDQIQIDMVKLKLASNDEKPTLDTRAYVSQDFGASGAPLNRTTVNMALVYQVPIYRREARGRKRAVFHELQSLASDEALLSQKIENSLEMTINALYFYKKRIDLANQEYALNIRIEKAENKRFIGGDGTLFILNQREEMTSDSKLKLIDLKNKYADYVANYVFYMSSFQNDSEN